MLIHKRRNTRNTHTCLKFDNITKVYAKFNTEIREMYFPGTMNTQKS